MPAPLLMTKLYIPSPGKHLVARERLVEKLNQCLEPGCRLTLVSAPAGFGKTTLIAAWVAAAQQKAAWLSIDDGDNDPVIFWSYVIGALRTQYPGAGEQALDALAVQGGELERKLALLINDLAQAQPPCVLVLDDYHLIRSPQIHQSLAYFVEHAPPQIHLMIASRTDPPLPLALLRGRGRLLEIRLNDLRFSDDEAEVYLNAGSGLNLAAQSVQALNQKTEGWIAGLQMATLAMRAISQPGQKGVEDFVASFSGSNRFILDYLIEEVLNRQPEAVQQFLLQTAILDQLCGPLCDAVTAGEGAQLVLERLESSNLFILPMDDQRCWYRYHHLFADLLRKRLAQIMPQRIPELHRRAVAWYEQNGRIPSAIHHAFQAQDVSKAAALVAQVTETMWGRGEHATLLGWIDALPEAEKLRYPHLLTFQVSMLISAGRLKEAEACIPVLERFIAAVLPGTAGEPTPEQAALIGNVFELRTYIASFYGERAALFEYAQTALRYLTREADTGKRCGVSLVLGNAYLAEGDLAAADRVLLEAAAAGKQARRPHMLLSALANHVLVLWYQGRLSSAAQVCEEGLRLVEETHAGRSSMAVDLRLVWGLILCERGLLDAALPYLRQGLEVAQEQQFIWQVAFAYQARARLLRAQGDLPGAEAAAQSAASWAEAHPVPEHLTCLGAGLLADLWLRQSKTAQAEAYLRARGMSADAALHYPHHGEYLAWAKLQRQPGGDADAARMLEALAGWAESRQLTGTRIAALLRQALLQQAPLPAEMEQALPLLGQALALAQPEGYLQTFVDEGPAMIPLLREARERGIFPEYVTRLLAACEAARPALAQPHASEAPGQAAPGLAAPQPAPANMNRATAAPQAAPLAAESAKPLALAEPLSRREMETLQLMAEGYSNKEIAQRMNISLRTVKYYSTGLYNKLGVDSRMQAVNRARELGLLSPR